MSDDGAHGVTRPASLASGWSPGALSLTLDPSLAGSKRESRGLFSGLTGSGKLHYQSAHFKKPVGGCFPLPAGEGSWVREKTSPIPTQLQLF